MKIDNFEDFPVLVGMHKSDVFKILAKRGIFYRISEEDGKRYNFSVDKFNSSRVNICIKDGIITQYTFY